MDPLCTLSDAIPAPVRAASVQEATIYPVVMSLSLFWKGLESYTKYVMCITLMFSVEVYLLIFISMDLCHCCGQYILFLIINHCMSVWSNPHT